MDNAASPSHAAGDQSNREIRILLVEDNLTNQEVAALTLRDHGYQVDTAENGQLALAALRQNHYHLVLMDCLMPVMDGFEATRRLRRGDPPTLSSQIPVIALTACAMPGDRERCLDAGMDDYVTKPIIESELLGAIGRVLARTAMPPPPDPIALAEVASAPIPVFDLGDMMHRLAGNRNIATVMLRRLLSDMPLRLIGLQAALAGSETQTAVREAHTIKGLAAGAGAAYLWQAARRIERLCKDGLLDDATQQLPELSAQLDLVLPEWKAFLEQNSEFRS
jgi:CheY-like chemotaxis protein